MKMATEQEEAHNLVSVEIPLILIHLIELFNIELFPPPLASGVRVGAERGGARGAQAAAHDPDGVLASLPDAPVRDGGRGQEGGQVCADRAPGPAQVRGDVDGGRDHARRHHVQGAAATAPAPGPAHLHQPGPAVEAAAGAGRGQPPLPGHPPHRERGRRVQLQVRMGHETRE